MKKSFWFVCFMLLAALQAGVQAADHMPDARLINYKPLRFGDYEVHYSAFNSSFIAPEIAERYSLERSGNYGIVNVAVRNVKDSDSGKAITAQVTGSRQNLLSQKSGLKFQEIQEAGAVYYLAGFRFPGDELLKFSINVTPTGSARTETIQFEQKFYQEE